MSGRDNYPRAGYPNGDPRETPADLAAVQADDALLDMFGGANHTPGDTDRELTRVLAAWRREIHADSNRVLVDTDTALAVINAARRPTRRRKPVFGSAAAAAAVLVIAFSSVGLVAKSAHPGDQLWGVTQVLYPEYSRSVEAAAFVRTELKEAERAFRQGKPEQARAKLQQVQQRLPAISDAEGRTDLIARQQDLEKMLDEQPGSPKKGSSTGPSDPGSSARTVAPTPTPEPASTPRSSPTPQPSPTPSTPEPSPTPKPSTASGAGPTGPDEGPGPTSLRDERVPDSSTPYTNPPSGGGAGGPDAPSPPG
jgi:hypothetical protein